MREIPRQLVMCSQVLLEHFWKAPLLVDDAEHQLQMLRRPRCSAML
jgi:hypothetical protein